LVAGGVAAFFGAAFFVPMAEESTAVKEASNEVFGFGARLT
jgi:hypothetical protein